MFLKKKNFRTLAQCSVALVGLLAAASLLSGCDLAENHLKIDRSAHLEFQDYRDALAPRLEEDTSFMDDTGIPALQPYMAAPSATIRPMPLVSISVNQTVPLRDVLYQLAEQADYDVELDPRIRGSIIFSARERPFDIVIQRIAQIAGLRYKFDDDILRVELDTPFNKTYKIDYLAYIRTNNSSIRNDVSVVTGQGADTGSAFEATGVSEADFWGELVTNLTQILGVDTASGLLRTAADPRITAVEQHAAPVQPVIVDGPDGERVQVQAPQAVLQVSPLPTEEQDNRQNARVGERVSSFSVNRQGGMVSVFGTEAQHREVEAYLQQLKRSVTAQVLIEAKILEVSLRDEFATGIDWGRVALTGKGALDITFPIQAFGEALDPTGSIVQLAVGNSGDSVNALVEAVSRFGTVRALASPRLTVLNNQSAVLNVAENLVYFEIDISVTRDEFGTQTDIDSNIRNVPQGVLINVQPSINLDDRTVSMAVRPTITSVQSFVNDPAVASMAAQGGANVTNLIPIVNIQEFDSVINMGSGETVVMGGLMQDRTQTNQQGVPVLKEIPLLGGLFRAQTDSVEKTELVVFLRATIIDGSNVHETDKELYRRFAGDRRPLRF